MSDQTSFWQPMDTAPKDGTEILAAIPVYLAKDNSFSHWDRHVICFDDDICDVDLDHENGWSWGDYQFWMPLPAPPELLP